jgi:hypothetical protein
MNRDDVPTERSRPHWWAVALGLVLVLVGAAMWLGQRPATVAEKPDAGLHSSQGARPDPTPRQALPEAERATPRPGAPERLLIPSLGVDSPVVPIRAPGGVLTPPADPQTLGWWADGARPGDARGSALVTGHTVSTGGGALDDLDRLHTGARVKVWSAAATTSYDVRSVRVYARGELAARAEELFDQSVPGRLVMITCEDWNGEEYLSNVVVTATPA